jgi:hypothetical protein
VLDDTLLGASPYVTAAFGLAGSLIGGFIAGTVSLLVARQARDAAERGWIRDSRREIYDRFLTNAQTLLIACEGARSHSDQAVDAAFNDFFEVYGVVQTVAERPVVDAARVYAYRLRELADALGPSSVLGKESFGRVARLIRLARHDTIDAMRAELGLEGSARPPQDFNPFAGTELEQPWAKAYQPQTQAPAR